MQNPKNRILEAECFVAPNVLDAEKSTSQKTKVVWWSSQSRLLIIAFVLLLLVAALFIAFKPNVNQVTPSNTHSLTHNQTQNSIAQTVKEAPWESAQASQARTQSQTVLAKLLPLKETLEAKNADQWAAKEYSFALQKAEQGDVYYREAKFVLARDSYQAAFDVLQTMNEQLPARINTLLEQAEQFIQAKQIQPAREAYQKTLIMDAQQPTALQGQKRVNGLVAVLKKLEPVENVLENNPNPSIDVLRIAKARIGEAQAIDANLNFVNALHNRVETMLVQAEYNNAMSQGLLALQKRQYSTARKAFRRALTLKKNDATANSLYRQTQANTSGRSLNALATQAEQYAAEENWEQAARIYTELIKKDPSQVQAKLGKIKSEAMQKLSRELDDILAVPSSLGDDRAYQAAQTTIEKVRALPKVGPQMRAKIRQIERYLQQAKNPIHVTLLSDANTKIELIKAGTKKVNLGTFKQKKLALKSGKYIVKGVRLGYQDVRFEFELKPGNKKIPPLTVQCTSKIDAV